MTKPIKLTKDRQGKSFYPATTTDAVVDQKRVKALSKILDDIDEAIANSGSSGGEGGALTENSVNTTHIVDGAVTTSKIARSAVTKLHIADNAVTTSKIADGNVTEEKLSEGLQSTIAALKNGTGLQEGVITMGKLEQSVQDAINDKGASVIIVNNLTEGGEDKALSAEMGKTLSERIEEVAENSGGLTDIPDNSITTDKMVDKAVTIDKLAEDVLDTIEELKTKKTVISDTLTAIESITQADYDAKKALGELSDTTAYLITELP